MPVNGTILLVEDDKFTARMMELQFQKNGFAVRHALDGDEALAILEEGPVDIVLSDMVMPGLSGLELLKRIRETHNRTELPFILLTASDYGSKVKEAVRLGANDFFTKAEDFSVLLIRVTLQINLKKAARDKPVTPGFPELARLSKDGLWDWRIEKGTAHFSSVWQANLGFGPGELEPDIDAWFERIHPDDVTVFRKRLQSHLDRKKPWLETDIRLLHKENIYLWSHIFGIALFNQSGKPVRMIGSMYTLQASINALPGKTTENLRYLEQQLRLLNEKGSDGWRPRTGERMLAAVQECLGMAQSSPSDQNPKGEPHVGDETTM